jgi:hypothetical protein
MLNATIDHPKLRVRVSALQLINKSHLFQHNQSLLHSPYRLQSVVPLPVFRDFLAALEDREIKITTANLPGLSDLCKEFGFDSLAIRLAILSGVPALGIAARAVRPVLGLSSALDGQFTFVFNGTEIVTGLAEAASLSPAVSTQLSVDACAHRFVIADREVSDPAISTLSSLLRGELGSPLCPGLEVLFGCLNFTELERSVPPDRRGYNGRSLGRLSVDALDQLLEGPLAIESEAVLLHVILRLGEDYLPLLRHVQWSLLGPEALSTFGMAIPTECIWRRISALVMPFPSLISPTFREFFPEFRGKRWTLLWRGSRDGFRASDFHSHCDGHNNTLVLISDRTGNIFGGFAGVEWDVISGSGYFGKWDPESFLFTLKNPHGIQPRRFVVNPNVHWSIFCPGSSGPGFGSAQAGFDLFVADACDTHQSSVRGFGTSFVNDTGVTGFGLLTGSPEFIVKEIEVFTVGD